MSKTTNLNLLVSLLKEVCIDLNFISLPLSRPCFLTKGERGKIKIFCIKIKDFWNIYVKVKSLYFYIESVFSEVFFFFIVILKQKLFPSFVKFEPKYVWLINMCIRAPETEDGGNPKQVSTGSGSDGHIISSSYRSSLCIFKVQSFKNINIVVLVFFMYFKKEFKLILNTKNYLIILLKPVFSIDISCYSSNYKQYISYWNPYWKMP